MSEPDELYTLRAQFWLGHYSLALEEVKAVIRRPMSPALKLEREDFLYRSELALGGYDKVISGCAGSDRPELQILGVAAEYYSAAPTAREALIDSVKLAVASLTVTPTVQLIASHIFLDAGMTKEALQCVHMGATMEQMAICLQIYLRIDRLDLAKSQLRSMKTADEDAILSQLGVVYVNLAGGSSSSGDALHSLSSLMEQYGPSPTLLNMMACGYMQAGNHVEAEKRLEDCIQEFPQQLLPDTLINLVVCCQQQGKSPAQWVTKIRSSFSTHPFVAGLDRVETAFDREAIKYRAK